MNNETDVIEEIVVIDPAHGRVVDIEVRHEGPHETIVVEIVDVEECGRANRLPPHGHRYKVRIDHQSHVFDHRFVTARALLERAGKKPPERWELEKRMHGGRYVPLTLDQQVDLGEHGIEVFESFPLDEREG